MLFVIILSGMVEEVMQDGSARQASRQANIYMGRHVGEQRNVYAGK